MCCQQVRIQRAYRVQDPGPHQKSKVFRNIQNCVRTELRTFKASAEMSFGKFWRIFTWSALGISFLLIVVALAPRRGVQVGESQGEVVLQSYSLCLVFLFFIHPSLPCLHIFVFICLLSASSSIFWCFLSKIWLMEKKERRAFCVVRDTRRCSVRHLTLEWKSLSQKNEQRSQTGNKDENSLCLRKPAQRLDIRQRVYRRCSSISKPRQTWLLERRQRTKNSDHKQGRSRSHQHPGKRAYRKSSKMKHL